MVPICFETELRVPDTAASGSEDIGRGLATEMQPTVGVFQYLFPSKLIQNKNLCCPRCEDT